MPKKVLIIIAEGSETVEIVAPVDTMRRVGIDVTIASIHGKDPVKTAADIIITPDAALSEIVDKDAYDAILLPGGDGHTKLAASELVGKFLRNQYDKGKLVCSICMSAHVFLAHKIAYGKKLTSYPFYKVELLKEKYDYQEDSVVQDGILITSRGPGTVYAYSTKIIENLVGVDLAKKAATMNLVSGLY